MPSEVYLVQLPSLAYPMKPMPFSLHTKVYPVKLTQFRLPNEAYALNPAYRSCPMKPTQ